MRVRAVDDARVVFVVRFLCVLTQEHAADHGAGPLSIARTIQALVRYADALAKPRIEAVYPVDASGEPPPVPTAATHRNAFVVLDAQSADTLLFHWGWSTQARAWLAADTLDDEVVATSAYNTLRCLSHAEWLARRDEYRAWQRELVARNVHAAQTVAHHAREARHAASCTDHVDNSHGPMTDHPQHTIVRFAPPRDANQVQCRAKLAALVPNAIDYVELRTDVAYVRCATAQAAATLVEKMKEPACILQGAEQEAYWAQMPLRVRNAARRRAGM